MGHRLDQVGLQLLGGALDGDVAQDGHPADQAAVLVEDARRPAAEAAAGRVRDLVLPLVDERSGEPVPELLAQPHVRSVLEQTLTARPDHVNRVGCRVENGAVQPGEPRELPTCARELDEHRHLRAQHVLVVGRQQIVDRAHLVAADDLFDPVAAGREEDDRRHARPLPATDHVRELDPVDPGHPDIEEDDLELLLSEQPESLLATRGAGQAMAERLQRGFERDQVVPAVVYEEDRCLTGRSVHVRVDTQLPPEYALFPGDSLVRGAIATVSGEALCPFRGRRRRFREESVEVERNAHHRDLAARREATPRAAGRGRARRRSRPGRAGRAPR